MPLQKFPKTLLLLKCAGCYSDALHEAGLTRGTGYSALGTTSAGNPVGYGSGAATNTPAQCLSYAESLGATSAALQSGKYNITIVTGRTKYDVGTQTRDFCNISLEHSSMFCSLGRRELWILRLVGCSEVSEEMVRLKLRCQCRCGIQRVQVPTLPHHHSTHAYQA